MGIPLGGMERSDGSGQGWGLGKWHANCSGSPPLHPAPLTLALEEMIPQNYPLENTDNSYYGCVDGP